MSNEVSILLRVDGVDLVRRNYKTVRDETKETSVIIDAAGKAFERLEAAQDGAAQSAARMATAERGAGNAADEAYRKRLAGLMAERSAAAAQQSAIASSLAAMRERNALVGASTELDRIERQIRLGNYAAYSAAQLNELRQLAMEYDAKQKLLDVERKRATQRGLIRDFTTGAASYAGVGFGATPLGAGLAAGAAVYFTSHTAIEFERAQKAIEAVTGSLETARDQMRQSEADAQRLGINVTQLAQSWAKFEAASKGTPLEGAQTRDVFLAVSEAAQKLNLRADQTEGVLTAVTQMMSKGKVQAEELRGQLGDRLPGAFNIMARALGVTTAELDKMMKAGGVASDEALPKFAAELRRTFGTDANTRIETTTANFTRLINEIKELAATIGGPLNTVLSTTAGALAEGLHVARGGTASLDKGEIDLGNGYSRNGNRFYYREPGAIPRSATQDEIQSLIAQQIGSLLTPTPGGYTTDVGALTGFRYPSPGFGKNTYGSELLSSGAGGDADEVKALRQKLLLLNEESKLRQVLLRIREGDLKDASNERKNAELALARAEDEKKAREDAAKAAEKQGKLDDRAATRDADAIRDQLARNAALQIELRTGNDVTDAQRRLLELQYKSADVSETTLADELKKGDELEQQVSSLKSRQEIAERLMRELDPSRAGRGYRRDVRQARTFGEIGSITAEAVAGENDRYAQQLAELETAREEMLRKGGDYDQKQADAQREHEQELTRIKREGEDSRRALTERYAQAGVSILGDAAEAAQAFGKRGFEAYKAISIAQTIISTYSSAQKAFDSMADIPYVGPTLGVAAAVAAIAAGMARVSAIQNQSYGGGRRSGGPVDSSRFYEVGEEGRPELVESGGRFWLLDTQGSVRAAQQAGASAAAQGMTVNIHNAPPGAYPSVVQAGNVVTIDMLGAAEERAVQRARGAIARDAADLRTPLSRNLRSTHRTSPKARR